MKCLLATAIVFASLLTVSAVARAEEDQKPIGVSIADGKITLQAPGSWVKKQPATRIVEVEFAIPKVEGDAADGRLTMMQAGGSVEDNISRWIGQFAQPDGKSTSDRTVQSEEEVDGQTVHMVDISGTFSDRRGPFAPAVQREDYRMLGAIVVTKDHGQQFIKLYGPRKTIAANEEAFKGFVKSLKVKD